MDLILDSKPHLLYETIAMVYSAVNHLSTLTVRDRMSRIHRGRCDDSWYRRLERLQEIQEDCCRDLDIEDGEVQHFFRQMETGCNSQYIYLAQLLTKPLSFYQHHDLAGEIELLKQQWAELQKNGCQVYEQGGHVLGLGLADPAMPQKSFDEQIYALKHPPELRLELLHAYLNYDNEMDRLERLLRPYADRLEKQLKESSWLMDSTVEYWRRVFETTTPEDFLYNQQLVNERVSVLEHRRVCFQLMRSAEIFTSYNEAGDTSLFVIGCAVLAESSLYHGGSNRSWVLSVLRSISDRNKFELLSRLSQEPSYCQKLAEEMGCHTGNISRNLTSLWKDGFLIRRESESRIYYETDKQRVSNFLQEVNRLLKGIPGTEE